MASEKELLKCKDPDYIPVREKLAYGVEEIYGGGYASLLGLVLLAFLTKSLQIAPAIAGGIILLSKAWDAVSDPLMGVISDNTRSSWGRRRPWITIGGLLIPVAFLLLFAPVRNWGDAAKIVFAGFAYIFVCTVNTLSQVASTSLSAEISPSQKERNNANSVRVIFSAVGAGICYLVPSFIFEKHIDKLAADEILADATKTAALTADELAVVQAQAGGITSVQFWLIMGLCFGLVFAVCVAVCGIFCRERVPYDKNAKSTFSFTSYKEPLRVRSFRYHIGMYICCFLCTDIVSALAVYYATDVMQGVTLFGMKMSSLFIIAPLMVLAALMFPLVQWAMRKKSKQFAYRMGLPLYALGGIMLAVIPRMPDGGPVWLILVASAMMGFGLGGAQMMPWIIFPDAVDVAALSTGKGNTGTYSGLMTFSRKLSSAVAVGLIGVVLNLCGYDKTQVVQNLDKTAVFLAIRIMLGGACALLLTLGFILSMKYKVTYQKMERVRFFLDHERLGIEEPLTDEEVAEKAALIEELC